MCVSWDWSYMLAVSEVLSVSINCGGLIAKNSELSKCKHS